MRGVKLPEGYVVMDGCWNCDYSAYTGDRCYPHRICEYAKTGIGFPTVHVCGRCPAWKKWRKSR